MSGGLNVLGGNSQLKRGLKLTPNNSKILTGITNTIDSAVAKTVSTVKDIGRRVVNSVKTGITNVFNKVNSFINPIKTISIEDYDSIMKEAIHNPSASNVMLGKYDGGSTTSYIAKAGDDYTYFDLGKNWNSIKKKFNFEDDDMFRLFNESFLEDGINARKSFVFSHNPNMDKGFLGQELDFLLWIGY